MDEELLIDYLIANNLKIYDDSIELGDRRIVDGCVIFDEISSCGYYKDTRSIPLLDIVAWVYSEMKDK